MKVFAIIFAFVVFCKALPYENVDEARVGDFITNIVNNTLNKVLANLSDPMVINDLNLKFGTSGPLQGSLSAKDIGISGIKSLIATAIQIDVGKQSLNMTLEMQKGLGIKLNYDIDAVLAELIPLYGKGLSSIDIESVLLTLHGKADINIMDLSKTRLKELEVVIEVGTSTFNINGMLNNPEFSALVNTALNDNFQALVNENKKLLSKVLSPILMEIINKILGGNSSVDVEGITWWHLNSQLSSL